MHALTFQQRPASRKRAAAKSFPWKSAVLTATTAACLTWAFAAERSADARVTEPPAATPAVSSPAVISVPESPEELDVKRLEVKRLEARNRRLEALVNVLRSRSESGR